MPRTILHHLMLGLLLAAAGCRSAGVPPGVLFWEKQDVADFELPHEKIERYQKLAASGRRKPAEEKEKLAQQLATEIRETKDPILRTHIVQALEVLPSPTGAKVLQAAISDEDEYVRLVAVKGLSAQGGTDNTRALARVVESEKDLAVRMAAIRGLGNLKTPEAVTALAIALDDPNPAIVDSTIDSLEIATGKYYARDAKVWAEVARGSDLPQKERSIAERLFGWK